MVHKATDDKLVLGIPKGSLQDSTLDLFRRAVCTLFTSQWEEPFGLVMVEALACGTPLIALRRGAAPEVIIDGKNGFLCDNEDEMVEATKKIDRLKPSDCRSYVEKKFSREKMAKDYSDIYEKILSKTKRGGKK